MITIPEPPLPPGAEFVPPPPPEPVFDIALTPMVEELALPPPPPATPKDIVL